MPYVKKEFFVKKPTPAFSFLMNEFDLSMKEAQRWVDRFRVYKNDICIMEKNHKLFGDVEIVVYEPNPKGLQPLFYEDDFVVYDKPSGVLVHPTSRKCTYSLHDEILSKYGKNAHVVHRLDKETSGLIMVAKDKKSEASLKMLFEKREVTKSYLAMVKGRLEKTLCIDAPLLNNQKYDKIKLRMVVDERGKSALTHVVPLEYFEEIDTTFVKVFPKTGRQHQIRVHLFHVKHHIIGDPIYGVDYETTSAYLDGSLSDDERLKVLGASRLLLHANSLEFIYKDREYRYESPLDIKTIFYNFTKERYENC